MAFVGGCVCVGPLGCIEARAASIAAAFALAVPSVSAVLAVVVGVEDDLLGELSDVSAADAPDETDTDTPDSRETTDTDTDPLRLSWPCLGF
jgi:hypothetical protein